MAIAEPSVQVPSRPSWWRRTWGGLSVLFASKTAVIGLAIVLFWVVAAILAPVLTPYSPTAQDYQAQNSPPSAAHILGTDDLGRDIWSRLLYGARVVLVMLPIGQHFCLPIGVANRGRSTGAAGRSHIGPDGWLPERMARRSDDAGAGRDDGLSHHPALHDHHRCRRVFSH